MPTRARRTSTKDRSAEMTRSIPEIFRSGETRSDAEVAAVNEFADASTSTFGEDITSAVAWAEIEEEARAAGITGEDEIMAWLEEKHQAFQQTAAWKRHEAQYQALLVALQEREQEALECGCRDCAQYLSHAAQGSERRRAWEAGTCSCSECITERQQMRVEIAAGMDADALLLMTAEACMAAAAMECTCEPSCGCQDPSCECEDCSTCLHAHGIGDQGERIEPSA